MDKVSIIITAYAKASKPYLDACVESIRALNYDQDKLEVIIVGGPDYLPYYPNVKTVRPDKEEFSNPVGINFGFHQASKDSKYFLYLNDDVILTKDSLQNFVKVAGDNMVILNPISPCDNYIFYNLLFPFVTGNQYDLKNYDVKELINAKSYYPPGLIHMSFLCLYASLIPRKVWERVGDWDENFETSADDIDYSYRAVQKGVRLAASLDCLIWHFSGRTADTTMTLEKRKASVRYFKKKWGQLPPFVAPDFVD